MAYEDDKRRKLNQAIKNDLDPRNRTSNGSKEKEKIRTRVKQRDLFPGAVFKIRYFPRDINGISDEWFDYRYYWNSLRRQSEAEVAGDFLENKKFTVRIACVPEKKSEMVLVERWPDGKLAVVSLNALYFPWDDESY